MSKSNCCREWNRCKRYSRKDRTSVQQKNHFATAQQTQAIIFIIMRSSKKYEQGLPHEKQLSPRSAGKELSPKQHSQISPSKDLSRKEPRLSNFVLEDEQEICLSPRDNPYMLEGAMMKKPSELKESVSTTSTYKEMSTKAKSCREPVNDARCLRKEDFVLGVLLGRGKFGSVFVARHRKTGFICALKVINKAKIMKQNIMHQLIREIKIQSYCDHPSLTKLYGYFSSVDEIFLITQLSSEGQLLQLIQKAKLHNKSIPEATIAPLLRQICEGVRYLHTLKIIHRDIKPQNIVMERGVVKICDFGWAVYHNLNLRSTFCGTPLYVSPEILKGENYDEKVDLWAVGILAWEMVYGDIPFQINCEQQLMKIVTDDIKFPQTPKVSADFRDFISKILKKNPKERLRVGGLLEHPFLQA